MLAIAGVDRHRHMHGHRLLLPDPVNAIVALFLNRRVPPARQVDDMCRRRQRQPGSGSLGTQNQHVEAAILRQVTLETVDDPLALGNGRVAVDQVDPRQSELLTRQLNEAILHLPVLDKHQRALTARFDPAQDLECRRKAARGRDEVVVLHRGLQCGVN